MARKEKGEVKSNPQKSNPLWGGKFKEEQSDLMLAINASIDFDKLLYKQDILGSIIHAKMLARQKIITSADAKKIISGLEQIEKEITSKKFVFKQELEDIHMNIEVRLKEIIGEPAGRLHTARSRNDQVATDFKLWVRDKVDEISLLLNQLIKSLKKRADENKNTLMPGFTHLQNAQIVTFAHHLKAYVEMFTRDLGRLKDARIRLNECPLGACALAGTSYPVDRKFTAKELGFSKPTNNSIDSVSDRDFALEYLSALSIASIHFSRFAEEIVLWCSEGFKFITLSDKFTTGSSIMPQKRNPDGAELVRGKTGRVIGSLNSLLITLKALPLSYSKDMQEDKEPVFDATQNFILSTRVLIGMVEDMRVNKDAMYSFALKGYTTATDLADYLVQKLNFAFRDAHHAASKIVAVAEEKGCYLHELTLEEMQKIEKKIEKTVFNYLKPENSVKSKKSFGGVGS
ncbi:MAG: argininosuccinate lyase [Alphaproteobacteria bacterium]|jgi:argininosuccinate lyase